MTTPLPTLISRTRRAWTLLVALATATVLALTMAAPPASARTDDLAGLWLFNEGRGQHAWDLSFSGNTGRLGSTPYADAQDPTWVSLGWLLPRSALRFSGSQRVTVANAPSLEPDGITMVVRLRGTAGGDFRYVAAKGSLACDAASYGMYTGANGGLQFYVSDGSDFTLSQDAGADLWDGRWHVVAGAYDGGRVRLWVDGKEVGAPVPSDIAIRYGLPDSNDLLLGDYAGPCGSQLGFVGDIDAAAVIGSYAGNVSIGS